MFENFSKKPVNGPAVIAEAEKLLIHQVVLISPVVVTFLQDWVSQKPTHHTSNKPRNKPPEQKK